MKILLYCVIHEDSHHPDILQAGLKGTSLQLVAEKDLAAVFSEIDQPDALVTTDAATQYHHVIARLHQGRTVVPFRFATLFDRISEVRQLLQSHQDRFSRMLTALDGCVEMGLRIMLSEKCLEDERSRQADELSTWETGLPEALPGTAYLLSRKQHYSKDLLLQNITRRTVQEYAGYFKDLCKGITYEQAVECLHEGERSVMVSVYFLVPRDKEQGFRDAFHALDEQKQIGARLTGPWPPYNFVVTNLAEEADGTSPSKGSSSLVEPRQIQ